jgi:hypothetical protein
MKNGDLATVGDLSDAELDMVGAGHRQSAVSVNVPTNVDINVAVPVLTGLNIAVLTSGTTQIIFQGVGVFQRA